MRRYKGVRMVLMLGFALLAMMGGARGVQAAFTPLVNQPPAFLNSVLAADGRVGNVPGLLQQHLAPPDAGCVRQLPERDVGCAADRADAGRHRRAHRLRALRVLRRSSSRPRFWPDGKVVIVGGEDLGRVSERRRDQHRVPCTTR